MEMTCLLSPSDPCSNLPQKHVKVALLISAASPLLPQIHLSVQHFSSKGLKAQTAWKNLHPGEFMNGVLAGSVTAT